MHDKTIEGGSHYPPHRPDGISTLAHATAAHLPMQVRRDCRLRWALLDVEVRSIAQPRVYRMQQTLRRAKM